MTIAITLEFPDGTVGIRGGVSASFVAKFDGDIDAARTHVLDNLVPVQNPGAIGRIEDVVFPVDKEFREAWTRGVGTIDVDMPRAREIQAERVARAKEIALSSLQRQGEHATLAGRAADAATFASRRASVNSLNLTLVGADIAAAATPLDLTAVFPAELSEFKA